MRRSFRTITRVATALLAGSVVALVAAYGALLLVGFKPAAVYSGSMEPSLGVGSLAVDRVIDPAAVVVGDVITFSDPYAKSRLITHRVVQIVRTKDGLAYRTKGDANKARDPWTVRLEGQVGRVEFSIPFAGYALYYLHTREVRGALLAIFALIALTSILRRIWRDDSAKLQEA